MNQYTSAGDGELRLRCGREPDSRTDASGTTSYATTRRTGWSASCSPSGVVRTLAYDALGNPISVTRDGVTTHLLYDPGGHGQRGGRVRATTARFSPGTSSGRSWSPGSAPGAQPDGPSSTGSGAWSRSLTTRGPSPTAIATTPTGTSRRRRRPWTNPFTFTGAYGVREEEGGLLDMRARRYDPRDGEVHSPRTGPACSTMRTSTIMSGMRPLPESIRTGDELIPFEMCVKCVRKLSAFCELMRGLN